MRHTAAVHSVWKFMTVELSQNTTFMLKTT